MKYFLKVILVGMTTFLLPIFVSADELLEERYFLAKSPPEGQQISGWMGTNFKKNNLCQDGP